VGGRVLTVLGAGGAPGDPLITSRLCRIIHAGMYPANQ